MDPFNRPQKPVSWMKYQRDAFKSGTQEGHFPPFSTDASKLESLAHEKLSQNGWLYASSNAGLGTTHSANMNAFKNWKIVPKMLQPNHERDTRIELFEKTLSAPIAFAPIGINKIYHHLGELPVAKVAGELGLPYTLSTAGSVPIEDAAKSNILGAQEGYKESLGAQYGDGLRYYQLYMPHDWELGANLLQRAVDSGYEACIFTVDTWSLGWRHEDVATSNYAFYKGIAADLGLSDKVFMKRIREQGIDSNDLQTIGERWVDSYWHGVPWSWDDLPKIIKLWKDISGGKPFGVKGIQRAEDAERCIKAGCEIIWVTNHAGRQIDGAIASLDALPSIAEKVNGRAKIIFDSGVRSGSDIFKAICLGADVVALGRQWIWGLSIQGEVGVRHVMKAILAEFDIVMMLAGVKNIQEIKENGQELLKYMPNGVDLALAAKAKI
ncbi:hypothetical protein L7F22_042176 [Adiantum nelumboides]|nr:hypothetical protein [Adiantum nelumboides]